MHYVTDLHLHSHYSRAVSPQMTLQTMSAYAKQKGLDILLKVPLQTIHNIAGERIAEGVHGAREGHLFIVPGYDGNIWCCRDME